MIYITTCRPDSVNIFRDNEYSGNNRIASAAMQRAVNVTIEEGVFSVLVAYTHYWATDVFSMDPPRESSRKSEVSRRTRMRMG
jgi:hypothetical protein